MPASSVLPVKPHCRVGIQRNSLSGDDNIYIYIYIYIYRKMYNKKLTLNGARELNLVTHCFASCHKYALLSATSPDTVFLLCLNYFQLFLFCFCFCLLSVLFFVLLYFYLFIFCYCFFFVFVLLCFFVCLFVLYLFFVLLCFCCFT